MLTFSLNITNHNKNRKNYMNSVVYMERIIYLLNKPILCGELWDLMA